MAREEVRRRSDPLERMGFCDTTCGSRGMTKCKRMRGGQLIWRAQNPGPGMSCARCHGVIVFFSVSFPACSSAPVEHRGSKLICCSNARERLECWIVRGDRPGIHIPSAVINREEITCAD